uniref:Uncharacterized protein n=1 Tax=Rhodopseudomonas palustris (strain BisA53) TaxID=316055 RepID=Q07ID3_RHOP5
MSTPFSEKLGRLVSTSISPSRPVTVRTSPLPLVLQRGRCFIAISVIVAAVGPAQRHDELITSGTIAHVDPALDPFRQAA